MASVFISLVIVLLVVGVILWAANRFVPMENSIRQLLNMVVIVGAVLYIAYTLLRVAPAL